MMHAVHDIRSPLVSFYIIALSVLRRRHSEHTELYRAVILLFTAAHINSSFTRLFLFKLHVLRFLLFVSFVGQWSVMIHVVFAISLFLRCRTLHHSSRIIQNIQASHNLRPLSLNWNPKPIGTQYPMPLILHSTLFFSYKLRVSHPHCGLFVSFVGQS